MAGKRRQRRKFPFIYKIVAVVLAVLLTVVLMEALLLVLGKTVVKNDFVSPIDQNFLDMDMKPGELYRPKPGNYPGFSAGTRINSLGYRGPEIEPKQPGTTRILAMGDSTVFGLFFPEEESWPSMVEKKLNEDSDKDFEVINMGRVAASSNSTRFDLETYGEQLDPDALIISVGWYNDYQRYTEDPELDDRRAIEARLFDEDWKAARSPLMYSRIYRIIRGVRLKAREAEKAAIRERWIKEGEFKLKALGHPRRVPIDQFEENLRAMCNWGKQREIPVFFTTPALFPLGNNPNYPENEETLTIVTAYADTIKKVANECGAHVIDTRSALLATAKAEAPTTIWIDYVHLWPKGNAIISDEVSQAIRESGMGVPPMQE